MEVLGFGISSLDKKSRSFRSLAFNFQRRPPPFRQLEQQFRQ
jgi:hypothetical protein